MSTTTHIGDFPQNYTVSSYADPSAVTVTTWASSGYTTTDNSAYGYTYTVPNYTYGPVATAANIPFSGYVNYDSSAKMAFVIGGVVFVVNDIKALMGEVPSEMLYSAALDYTKLSVKALLSVSKAIMGIVDNAAWAQTELLLFLAVYSTIKADGDALAVVRRVANKLKSIVSDSPTELEFDQDAGEILRMATSAAMDLEALAENDSNDLVESV